MPPISRSGMSDDNGLLNAELPVLNMASEELEKMRVSTRDGPYHSFPPACLTLLKSMEGNHRCMDCGEHDPQWAAVSYGGLLCLQCSGIHRGLGVQVSCVRSIVMDNWSQAEVLSMLEGGNAQLLDFFERHNLSTHSDLDNNSFLTTENVAKMRYKTKAALFYRQQMGMHVAKIIRSGTYRGREASRRIRHRPLEHRNSAIL